MKRKRSKPTHVTRKNVLDDIGLPRQKVIAVKFKAEVYQAILKYADGYSQKQLQSILGEPQPRVSELLNGKIANKSVDKLLEYAGRLGVEPKVRFTQMRTRRGDQRIAAAD
jgi:predicted XRE-type DNA-binding protein